MDKVNGASQRVLSWIHAHKDVLVRLESSHALKAVSPNLVLP